MTWFANDNYSNKWEGENLHEMGGDGDQSGGDGVRCCVRARLYSFCSIALSK